MSPTPIQDFLFGQYATDEGTLGIIRSLRRGIDHSNHTSPQRPLPDQPVTLHITVGPESPIDRLLVIYSTDGDPIAHTPTDIPHGIVLEATRRSVEWNTPIWGYLHHYVVTIPPLPVGTRVSYVVMGWSELEQRAHFADTADSYAHGATRFVYHLHHHSPPAWAYDAVFYQIFLDRFHPGADTPFPGGLKANEVWGGTLAGVRQALPYLQELGITALWLSPIYPSDSHHGYDVRDYRSVNPRIGTLEEMKALVQEVHEMGMHLILDFVPNHSASDFPLFQDALNDPDSLYREWFYFRDYPHSYEAFFNLPTLPKINADHPAARRYLIDAACFWVEEVGVDGFRMDHAHGTSVGFWSDYYDTIKCLAPDTFTMGEITETANYLRQYRGRLDGVLDFLWLQVARRFFLFDGVSAPAFEHFLEGHEQFFDDPTFLRPTFLDNHDMNRFLWSAKGDIRRLKLAALCQFTQSAPPIIYYGTEVGVTQERDVQQGGFAILEESRSPMAWGDSQNPELLDFYRRLIRFRRTHPATYRGERQPLLATPDGVLVYVRHYEGAFSLTVLNNSDEGRTLTLDLSKVGIRASHLGTITTFCGFEPVFQGTTFTLDIAARHGTIVVSTPP
jgi:cyclomaltodextrinase / maltogenic alpha-amylase / neopullulanase